MESTPKDMTVWQKQMAHYFETHQNYTGFDSRSHQLQLSRYIHRNPLDAGIVDKLEDGSAVFVQEKFMFCSEMDDIINRVASVFSVSSESVSVSKWGN